MVRTTWLAALLALTALPALRPAGAGTADAPTVKEIMKKANSPTGVYANLGQDLKDDSPTWADIQQEAKDLAGLASQLRQATPPRGDKDSWSRLTKAYADSAKSLQEATAKMDQDAARTAWSKMGGDTCKSCHKVHRPPE
jgi:cytochrome c556